MSSSTNVMILHLLIIMFMLINVVMIRPVCQASSSRGLWERLGGFDSPPMLLLIVIIIIVVIIIRVIIIIIIIVRMIIIIIIRMSIIIISIRIRMISLTRCSW